MANVNDLLARLKTSANSGSPSHENETLRSSPFSGLQHPQPHTPYMQTPFAGMASPPPSAFASGNERATSDRSANLLNLLKFNNAPSPGISALPEITHARATSGPASQLKSPPPASGTPQEALLKLLNRAQPTAIHPASATAPIPAEEFPVSNGNAGGRQPHASAETLPSIAKTPVFSYVNPFDELAASAPTSKGRQTAPKIGNSQQASQEATPGPDSRSNAEALIAAGFEKKESETVSDALKEVGQQANEQASDALARAETSTAYALDRSPSEVHDAMQEAAVEISAELKNKETKEIFEAGMPPAMIEGFEETIRKVASGEPASGDVADSWESADSGQEYDTRVFGFPMRPFVSIDVLPDTGAVPRVRDEIVMKIASLKREFDQVDRTLAAATTNHIVYAMSKGGGFRVIRQDDGSNKHVFKNAGNQIFNIAIGKSGKEQQHEPILATGVNGSVYWTGVPIASTETFNEADLDKQGFQFPPLASQEENNSGVQLKTRAKLSSRHPEFFAVGRGKSIHIVWPQLAMQSQYCDQNTRIVDSDKYLTQRSLKIATGKAGKDFAFSEDDSVLVSLDKAGRLKFWDIKEHTDPKLVMSSTPYIAVDTRMPLMLLATSSPEKSWATSVQFLDKERPMTKGSALRYLLVGSKQNHTLHLWDLMLAKPVQEINFPHENEMDPICSITYHAKTGIVAVGHPTRNSIYFIQLSAPRYNLSHMSQASYVERLAKKDMTLPKPESTAIMSSMREISLVNIGQLRSLELSSSVSKSEPDENILEVYIMHSRGMTCLNLKRQDVGIGEDGKPFNPVKAEEAGRIKVSDLHTLPYIEPSDASDSGHKGQSAAPSPAVAAATKDAAPQKQIARSKDASPSKAANISTAFEPVTTEKKTKPRPKTSTAPPSEPAPSSLTDVGQRLFGSNGTQPKPRSSAPMAQLETATKVSRAIEKDAPSARNVQADQPSAPMNEETADLLSARLGTAISSSMGGVLSEVFTSVLGDQMEKLYKRIDDDKRIQEAAGAAKQDAILRLVSSTLTDNVERSLFQIVNSSIDEHVVPSIKTIVAQSVDRNVSDALASQLQTTVPRELKMALAPAIGQAMKEPAVLRAVSDQVSGKISKHVEEVFVASLRNSIAPSFEILAVESAKRVTGQVSSRIQGQLEAFDMKQRDDNAKIDRLTALTSELLQTVRAMAETQGDLQGELLQLRTEISQYQHQAASAALTQSPQPSRPTFQDPELDAVAELMSTGRQEEATIRWLQSARQAEMFDQIFVRADPRYLRETNQIVTLSVCAAVTATLESNMAERLEWLETALASVDVRSPEIAEHAAGVMDALTQRLQDAYMSIAEVSPSNPSLAKIHGLVRKAKQVKSMSG